MKELSQILGGAFLILSLIFIAPTSAYACTCAQPPSPQEAVEGAEAVFIGKVIQISDRKIKDPDDVVKARMGPFEVSFEVGPSWKGSFQDKIVVYSALGDSSFCGINFKEGRRYLVYAYEYEGELQTSSCTRSTGFPEALVDIFLLEKEKTINSTSFTFFYIFLFL